MKAPASETKLEETVENALAQIEENRIWEILNRLNNYTDRFRAVSKSVSTY